MTPKIDFLPESYHQRRHSHQKTLWRRSLLAVFLALIIIGSLGLKGTNARLQAERDSLQANARAMHAKLGNRANFQQQIVRLDAEANVITLLRVNSSPTRVLAAISESLPRFVTLTEFRLAREKLNTRVDSPAAPNPTAAEAQTAPAELDLARLRESSAETVLVASIKGLAPDDIAISKLLAALHSTGFFSDSQLLYTDQENVGELALRSFAIRLTLRRPNATAEPAEAHRPQTAGDHVSAARREQLGLAIASSPDAGTDVR